jgi:S1-C subfamily serine protease
MNIGMMQLFRSSKRVTAPVLFVGAGLMGGYYMPGKQLTTADIIERVKDSVVTTISATGAKGSGFFINNDGYFLTTNHGLSGRTDHFLVTTSDGMDHMATFVAALPRTDLAVLHIDVKSKSVSFADTDRVRVGDPLIEISNPFGVGISATGGMVSAKQMVTMTPGVPEKLYIQTDAATNAGSSGGPLFDKDGKVLGMITDVINLSSIFFTNGMNAGVNMAVPADIIKAKLQTVDMKNWSYVYDLDPPPIQNTARLPHVAALKVDGLTP